MLKQLGPFLITQATGGTATTPTPAAGGAGTATSAGSAVLESTQSFSILPQSGPLVKAIQTGDIHISDIPKFIRYFIEMGIIAAGTIAFLMLLFGGYQYIVGGVYSDMRDQGKTTITYAITGLVLSLLSYAIVNIIQLLVTAL